MITNLFEIIFCKNHIKLKVLNDYFDFKKSKNMSLDICTKNKIVQEKKNIYNKAMEKKLFL